jgi:hypothetical protein
MAMRWMTILAGGIACLSAATALAARNDTGLMPADSREAQAGAGLTAYIDPRTGELVKAPVTPDQRNFAQGLPRRDYSRMRLETEPDGSVVLHTNGQLQMSAVVTQDADGHVHEQCLPSGQEPQP